MHKLTILSLLTAAVTAQIPTDTVLVLESTAFLDPYYKFVDAFGRGTTTLREQGVFKAVDGVAVDPSSPQFFYFLCGASSLAGTWRAEVGQLAEIGINNWGAWSQTPAERIAVGSTRIVTLDGSGGIQAFTKNQGPAPIALSVPQATDIAIAGDLLYTVVFDPFAPAALFENNLATSASRTVGNYLGATSVAVTPDGLELCVGTQSGDLLRIDVATGNITSTLPTGLGEITAVGFTRLNTIVYTDGFELWSELSPNGPIYTSPTAIVDIDVATAAGASVVPYGTGCGIGVDARWVTTSLPTLGNTNFVLALDDGPALSFGLLALGASRTLWSAPTLPLPFDLQPFGAPGCQLLVDPATVVLQTTNAIGRATQLVPIPSTASLVGVEFVAQWLLPDAGVGPFGFATTEGLAFVID